MRKLLKILLYLPMPFVGGYYGVMFSIPGDSDTVPFASVMIGLMLVALPMLVLSVLSVAMFVVSFGTAVSFRKVLPIGGMIIPIIAFLWLSFLSSFRFSIFMGIYAFVALVCGSILLMLDKISKGERSDDEKT